MRAEPENVSGAKAYGFLVEAHRDNTLTRAATDKIVVSGVREVIGS